ncbi:hypothetical protein [Chondromyces apiculatus]|uniref:Uncharacterized protein n=1 Tax=Chondromyces apiculatus DSM 436 TaxID=1192034 RepID=A0A017T3B0_9BACT|nr:hypothetical protein [Chondromyces apiculatus]EYF03021.1 Hypothetical protein CAP_6284 [Chondromyces apiculatus DSM 436]
MSKDSFVTYSGPLNVDLSHLDGVLLSAAAGATKGMHREQEGFAEVEAELARAMPVLGDTIGVGGSVHARIVTTTDKLAQVRAAKLVVDKLAQALTETEILLENEREADIGLIVSAARFVARRKDRSVIALFQRTIRYHGQISLRGAKTRRRNAERAAEAAEAEAEAEKIAALVAHGIVDTFTEDGPGSEPFEGT